MYVDGFITSVPGAERLHYIENAKAVAALFIENGAIRVTDCWGEDIPEGKLTSFPLAVKREAGEVVCLSWIEYSDKATRDHCHEKVFKDPRLEPIEAMPFDGGRMIYGGFEVISDAR